jgi:predicted acylesterase/phospholipase RssA
VLTVPTVDFENIVFSGGGNRCFWQAGFWSVAAAQLKLKPKGIVAVSAGSAMACALFSGTFEHGFSHYKQAVTANKRNLYWHHLLQNRPLFPHGLIYRQAILNSIDDAALKRLHQGPEIRILMARAPRWASRRVAMVLGALASGIDSMGVVEVHPTCGVLMGFRPLHLSVRDCATPNDLANLIVASSCIPPLTPQARSEGMAVFDGGVVSNVPADWVHHQAGKTLVLLTRQFDSLPYIAGRTYVQPSEPIPVGAWDYTNGAAVQSTFDLGRRDGEAFCKSYNEASDPEFIAQNPMPGMVHSF